LPLKQFFGCSYWLCTRNIQIFSSHLGYCLKGLKATGQIWVVLGCCVLLRLYPATMFTGIPILSVLQWRTGKLGISYENIRHCLKYIS
jgi:hypothetical protein